MNTIDPFLSPNALHIPDGFLNITISIIFWVLTIIFVGIAVRKTRGQFGERQIPLMGVMAAFIFAAQMINFPVAGGTSGHLLGGALAAIVLGPWAGMLVMTTVVGVQALVFQDGGLLVMGANIFNMGLVTALIGYGIYRGAQEHSRSVKLAAAGVAAWLSVVAGALLTAIQLWLSGISTIQVVFPAMLGVHVLIGVGEALITVANSHGWYGPTQTYQLYAGEIPAPTPTPTHTPQPTAMPRPTRTPAPTATPARPIVSFSADTDRVERPGECVTLRWSVERATEVFLVYPNGSREGVIGHDERRACPLETSVYTLAVHAPGGDETVEVQVRVPLPTQTPTPKPPQTQASKENPSGKGSTVHAVVFVDENRSQAYDPREGVLGAGVTLLSQADPGQVWTGTSDALGQVHFPQVPSGSYTLLIPHLGYAELLALRGDDLTLDVLVTAIRLPSRIP